RDRHGRDAAFLDRAEALLGSQLLFQDMARILNLPAAGAGQIAAVERLEHQHERVPLPSLQLLAQDVSGDPPHLGRGDRHIFFAYTKAGVPLRCRGWKKGNASAPRTGSSGWSPGKHFSTRSRNRRTPTGLFGASETSAGRCTARSHVI